MDVNINGKLAMNAQSLVKIDPKKELDAIDVAARNRADDIFFRAGGDLFVASGTDLKDKVKTGQAIEVAGIKGKVTAVDHEAMTLHEEFSAGAAAQGAIVGMVVGGAANVAASILKTPRPGLIGLAAGTIGATGAYHIFKDASPDDTDPDYKTLKAFASTDTSIPVSAQNGLSDELTAGAVAGITQIILQKTKVKDLDKKLAADYAGTVKQYVTNETAQKCLLKLGETVGDHAASNFIAAGVGAMSGTAVELMKDDSFRALSSSDPSEFAKELAKRGGKNFLVSLGAAFVTGKVAD